MIMRVLVIDDDEELRDLVARALIRDGHVVVTAGSTQHARAQLIEHETDLIVLDLGLPDGSGKDLCQDLRNEGSTTPVLVLTAQNAVASRVACLDAGADDYLGKPFAVAELRARVRALGRRPQNARSFVYRCDGVRLDFTARRATVDEREAPVTAREWSILELLAARSGRVVSRSELLDGVWGDGSEAASASLDVLIGRIRRKLAATVIRTVRGEGYALGE